ncbi:MAG: hypothetical protein JJT77_02180 [Crocinitomicaceae bacterium]|nr:hypothetical protein [Crocinitomicaceae bacterium]
MILKILFLVFFCLSALSASAQFAGNRDVPPGEWDKTRYNTRNKRGFLRLDEFGGVKDANRNDVIIVENNAFRDIDGVLIGRFDPITGEVRNHSGRKLGVIDDNNAVFKWDGTPLGIERGINREQAALVYFLWDIYLGLDRVLILPGD